MNPQHVPIVTGAGGFIGERMVQRLEAVGLRPFAWTRAEGDLRDQSVVARRVAEIAPTLIFHLAAVSARDNADSWSAAADEVRMVSNLAFAMPPTCRLIYAGSMAEFGYSGHFEESAACRPTTAYGFAKASGTQCALALRITNGFDIRVARLFGVYGPGERDDRLVPYLVSRLSRGRPVPLSDGRQVRDFVHVDDVCDTLVTLSEAPDRDPPLVNVGTGVGVSVRAVCESVARTLAADPALLQFGATPRRAVDEDRLVARTDRLAELASVPRQRWLGSEGDADYVLALHKQFERAAAGGTGDKS